MILVNRGERRNHTMDPLPEHEIINEYAGNEEKERVLDRLRRNDPTLKELTLGGRVQRYEQTILQVFDAIATNTSLKVLSLYPSAYLDHHGMKDRIARALITNTSVKHLCLRLHLCNNAREVLDIVRVSPNLEALTLQNGVRFSIEDIAALAQGLCVHMNLHSLTMEGFYVGSDEGAAFAAAFQANQTIKTLIMRRNFIEHHAAVSFVEALPHDHSLETIIFDSDSFDDDRVLSIIRTLCHKHLKNLSLVDCFVSQDGCERIIQFLKENEHSFIKLKLFPDYAVSPWQNKIRLEIEELTWNNYLQDEKDKWLDQFLGQDARTKELLFRALERAKNVDNEQFSKAPNLLFHLIKESPELIAQAIRDGL